MTDNLEPAARRALMSRIRQRDTAPEVALRKSLYALGFRYRLHPKLLPGRPDLVFPSRRIALFVHGCFWHGHGCRAGRRPTSNSGYWNTKLEDNQIRDERKASELRAAGWDVLTVWECELKPAVLAATVERIVTRLTNTPVIEGRAARLRRGK